MWRTVSLGILKYRIFILIALAAITLFMGYQAVKVQLSYDFAKILPDNDPDFKNYKRFKQKFGEDGNVFVIGIKDASTFHLEAYQDLYELSAQIKKMDGIEEVLSVARIFTLQRNDSLKKFDIVPLGTKPKTQAEADSIKIKIEQLPFFQGLIYDKETGANLMAITFDKNKLNTKNRINIVDSIQARMERFGQKHHIKIHYSGLPFIRTAITRKVANELFLFLALAIFVTAIILWLFFRSASVVFFSMIVVITGVIWSVGTITLLHYKITILTGLIPPIIIVIGVPNCILLLNKYQSEFKKHGQKLEALPKMVEKIGITTLLANVTTSIGFGVLCFTSSAILIEFGLVAALNVMATWLISLVLIPIVFSYLPAPSVKSTTHLKNKLITHFLERIDLWVHHFRWRIYSLVGLILVVSVIGICKIRAVGFVVDDLPKKDPIYTDLKFFEHYFKGVLPFEIYIDAKKPGAALSMETLSKIYLLQKKLQRCPEFSHPLSLVEGIRFSYQAFRGGKPKYYNFPNNPDQLSALAGYTKPLKGKENMFRSFIDSSKQTTRVSVQMADIGSIKMKVLVDKLRPAIDSIFPPEQYIVKLTGNSLMFLKGTNFLVENLIQSVLLAILLISILMVSLFMSFRMIAVSIVPSIIPLIVTAGLMGFFNIPLKPSTILVFSIAFGIASDGTIYFLTKYRQEFKSQQSSISKTVSLTIRETGLSMIYTAAILFSGFSIFTASQFGGTAALGILISVTLLMAMGSNLILLPAFLLSLEKRLTKRALLKESHIFKN
jgi:predicted RND superfamily exporter protein